MRDIFEVLKQIKEVLDTNEEYDEIKANIENIEYSLRYKAPEDRWNYVQDKLIDDFIPPTTDIDYKVLSVWTTKSVEELKGATKAMSKADEMFEELGYEKIVEHKFKEPEGEEVTELILYCDEVKSLEIEFWNDKTISKMCGYDVSYITIQELQAINEKVKELRLVKQLNKEIKSIKEK